MREILFRGKRCDNGEWVQGYYIRAEHHWHNHGIHKDWITLCASANGGWFALHNKYAVKSETVGQFTGLTDKNGKKIFEGDIVWHHLEEEDAVIQFYEGGFIVNFFKSGAIDELRENSRYLEVTSNIHDNHELLENP